MNTLKFNSSNLKKKSLFSANNEKKSTREIIQEVQIKLGNEIKDKIEHNIDRKWREFGEAHKFLFNERI